MRLPWGTAPGRRTENCGIARRGISASTRKERKHVGSIQLTDAIFRNELKYSNEIREIFFVAAVAAVTDVRPLAQICCAVSCSRSPGSRGKPSIG